MSKATKTDETRLDGNLAVIGGVGNIPFTLNTSEARLLLEKEGFSGLSFYQGKKYIYPIISTWSNKNSTWKEKNYSTFSESDGKDFLMPNVCQLKEFMSIVRTL